jgi:hypothetical protein
VAKLSLVNDRELTTMRKSLIRLALAGAAVTAIAAAGVAGAAVAQIPAPPPPPAPPAPPAPPPIPPLDVLMAARPDMGFMREHFRAPDPEKRAQRLRDVLQLRPDQDRALKAYVDATSPKPFVIKKEEARTGEKDGAEPAPPTTLERLDHMSKAADAMKARAEATRAFYLALTPSQQKTFDVLGLDDSGPGERIHIHRLDTRGPDVFKGERKVIIQQRKVG